VESVKMFEISAFSALLERPRSKFPLVPPFIELPFIGSLASIPLPGAREYHRSTAIVSAVIVPTAADLAYGIDFARDRQAVQKDSNVELRDMSALNYLIQGPQLEGQPIQIQSRAIRAFNKAMVNCLATRGKLIFPGGPRDMQPSGPLGGSCLGKLTFDNVPNEY
jgi:hypothetical protein